MNLVVDVNTPLLAGWAHNHSHALSVDPVHGESGFVPDEEVFSLLHQGVLYNPAGLDPLLGHIWSELDVPDDVTLTLNQNAWADPKISSKLAEIAFEKYHIGDLNLCKRQLSTAYALGKPHACLVLDIDYDHVSVVPVSNGKVLAKGVVKSNYGGDFINLFSNNYLQSSVTKTDLIPLDYLSKKSESWQQFMTTKTLKNFNRSILTLYGDQPVTYITPNSRSVSVSVQTQRDMVQPLFRPYQAYASVFPQGTAVTSDAPGIGGLIFQCLKSLSAEDSLYQNLLSNLVIQGELSFIPGLEDGILSDLRGFVKDYQISSFVNLDDMERLSESWLGAGMGVSGEGISRMDWFELGESQLRSRFA